MTLPLWLSVPLILVLAIVFSLNVYRGLTSGTIWLKSTKYRRVDEPFFFWFTVVAYAILIVLIIGGLAVAAWALVA
jgi:hypothetical protein